MALAADAEGPSAPVVVVRTVRLTAIAVLLVLITGAAFWQVRSHRFLLIDDPLYVVENSAVRAGITAAGFRWALTATHAMNWHPVTWLSHMLDVEFFGLNPGAHHLTNLGWHTANTVMLFLLLRALTGAVWSSALTAALFAVHPLRAESVAWISERKDVLSAFFWLTASLAYVRYVRDRRPRTYAAVQILYVLGLMAKPMVVTLPLVFLLLDFWPLGRLLPGPGRARTRLVLEKLPFLPLAAVSAVATLIAQKTWFQLRSLADYPLSVRIENSLISYLKYLGMTIWPEQLVFPYHHPGTSLTLAEIGGAALLLLALTATALSLWRRAPYLSVGWLWFLGTLIPVIGLVQVSDQGMADRYTYLPLIGPVWALACGLADGIAGRPRLRAVAGAAAGVLIAGLVLLTRRQVAYWHDDRTLFGHTNAVIRANNLARDARK